MSRETRRQNKIQRHTATMKDTDRQKENEIYWERHQHKKIDKYIGTYTEWKETHKHKETETEK